LIYARLNRPTGKLQLVNAAHPPAILLRGLTGRPQAVHAISDVVGAFPDAVFDCQELQVDKGDRLFLYTDGLTEGCPGGLAGLLKAVGCCRQTSLQEAVRGTLNGYTSSGCCEDDVLLMGVEI
jgi:sigma-B regulation protein RsbU (phosphoserine phosphatase)